MRSRQQITLELCCNFMGREEIIHEALLLDRKERELLAEELLVSVDLIPTSEIENLWKKEAERRLDALKTGFSQPLNGLEFMQKLRNFRL